MGSCPDSGRVGETGAEKPAAKLSVTKVAAAEKPAAGLSAAEVVAAEKPADRLSAAEKPAAKMSGAGLAAAELSVAKVATTEKPAAEVVAAATSGAEKPAAKKPITDKSAESVKSDDVKSDDVKNGKEGEKTEPAQRLLAFFSSKGMVDGDGRIMWWTLVLKMISILALFLIVFGGLAFIFRDRLDRVGMFVGDKLGLPGVALFAFLVDTFIVPMSVDVVFPFASRWNPALFLAVLSCSSIVAGFAGYWIGRLLGFTRIVRKVTEGFSEDGKRLIKRYGAWAVVIAALTPIPYSTVCWLAGMVKVPVQKVALACLWRAPRMIVYYLAVTGAFSVLA